MVDQEKVREGVRLILEGIGEDINREGLIETPDRIARMYCELAGGMDQNAATHLEKRFHVDNADMVVEKDITFYSMCEHHMLPFLTAQIADAFMDNLHPQGVMVMIEAEHLCMTMRGIKKPGAQTVTTVTRGVFDNNKELQDTFYQMVRL